MKSLPPLPPEQILAALEPVSPGKRVRAVLDTDAFNEVDDQFAIVQCLLHPEELQLEAIYAAPFFNERSASPGDGMRKSYDEILRVLDRLNEPRREGFVFHGSADTLQNCGAPLESAAALDLIERAHAPGAEGSLYVLAIGAASNIASAIYLDPSIREKIVVVWLGGRPHWMDAAHEFNLSGDLLASQCLFDSGVPLVQIPTAGVAELLQTTLPELEQYVAPCGPLGRFLTERVRDFTDDHFGWSKVIWDISVPAWVLFPDCVPTRVVSAPVLDHSQHWQTEPARHPMRIATSVRRNGIYRDLFTRLQKFAPIRESDAPSR